METDDAVEILHTIGREKRELILDALDEDIKKEIRSSHPLTRTRSAAG